MKCDTNDKERSDETEKSSRRCKRASTLYAITSPLGPVHPANDNETLNMDDKAYESFGWFPRIIIYFVIMTARGLLISVSSVFVSFCRILCLLVDNTKYWWLITEYYVLHS